MNFATSIDGLKNVATDDNTISLTIDIDDNCRYLAGHFPDQPILPGVAILHWACLAAEEHFDDYLLRSVSQLKFMRPVVPGDRIELTVSRQSNGSLRLGVHADDTLAVAGVLTQ